MDQKIVFPTGGIFIGIKRKGDANTNKILHEALVKRGFSTETEGKQYKDETVDVWIVDADFVNMLYAEEWDFKLKFIVYMELEYIFQEFHIVEPIIRKKARHARYRKKYFKK